jgi:hypothetical protein
MGSEARTHIVSRNFSNIWREQKARQRPGFYVSSRAAFRREGSAFTLRSTSRLDDEPRLPTSIAPVLTGILSSNARQHSRPVSAVEKAWSDLQDADTLDTRTSTSIRDISDGTDH